MTSISADRRQFLRGSGAVATTALSLKYGAPALAQTGDDQPYGQ